MNKKFEENKNWVDTSYKDVFSPFESHHPLRAFAYWLGKGVYSMLSGADLSKEKVEQIFKEHFLDDGRMKGGINDWLNV